MKQAPQPGKEVLRYCGDLIVFELDGSDAPDGKAFLRTNLGRAGIRRKEIIAATERGETALGRDWHDIAMVDQGNRHYTISLPLTEVGRFEAKTFILPNDGGRPVWMPGDNAKIKVEPAGTVIGNTIYTVFPRQFGVFRDGSRHDDNYAKAIKVLDDSGYTVIPPSGTFRDVIKELDFIIGRLGCRYLQLLPIHPAPTVYGRMGRYGSPYAVLDFFAVDSALTEFDKKVSPLEQFGELIDEAHARGGKVLIDIPVDHTGWGARLQSEHPEYFVRNGGGEFKSPGAWGVVWEDLIKLDYDFSEIHRMMADIFLFWCAQGVDGFRCDAGYMLPASAWKYITAKVREQYPDTLFLLEGLGGPIKVMEDLLSRCGLNWAYSELFQNYSRDQVEWYLPQALDTSATKGLLVNFSETHDNSRLAARSREFARLRTAFCALTSPNGAFGFANGLEWYATEQIDVHGSRSLNWGSKENMIEFIRRIHLILRTHPAFGPGCDIKLLSNSGGNSAAVLRRPAKGKKLIILANLSDDCENLVVVPSSELGKLPEELFDLLSGETFAMNGSDELRANLQPGQVICLSSDSSDFELIDNHDMLGEPERSIYQRFRKVTLQLIEAAGGFRGVGEIKVDELVGLMSRDPDACFKKIFGGEYPPLVYWTDGVDQSREVMVPPGCVLIIRSDKSFYYDLKENGVSISNGISLPVAGDGFFAFIVNSNIPEDITRRSLFVTTFGRDEIRKSHSELLFLPKPEKSDIRMKYSRCEVRARELYAICANRRGAMAQIRAAWGELGSKYDALLAANCNDTFPVDRTVMFTRCRGWVVCNDYSQELTLDCMQSFTMGMTRRVGWQFQLPVGQGKYVSLQIDYEIDEVRNSAYLKFTRKPTDGDDILADDVPAKLILRPDIEARCNHEVTKAYSGAEELFPASLSVYSEGFDFDPYDNRLSMRLSAGSYVHEPEWMYMVNLPVEIARGLEASTDLFSPGYFTVELMGGTSVKLCAAVDTECQSDNLVSDGELPAVVSFEQAVRSAIDPYVVKRDDLSTVIAGYPWFLDWGRDTLICLRGMIAAGMLEQSRAILHAFARFERNGTIPNMIRGGDDSNRDTSDAPLWLFTATADYIKQTGPEVLQDDCGGRSLLDILLSIAENIKSGTPNGIYMDRETGLVFSPSHYTWMDTNYPAGTPRQGYPIEIQALWFAALKLLAQYADKSKKWDKLADKVRFSIHEFFVLENRDFLSDCLHCEPGQGARAAVADDACRCNQLFALTLGAVDDPVIVKSVLTACEDLLIPGAIRSLADLPVEYPLPVYLDKSLLNDSKHPYWGVYAGDEDTRRKPAYHNGTAWTWPFPSYCEALFMFGGEACRKRALAVLMSSRELLQNGVPGQVPEVIDGNAPHIQRGCGAQAWGVTELFRVYKLIEK